MPWQDINRIFKTCCYNGCSSADRYFLRLQRPNKLTDLEVINPLE